MQCPGKERVEAAYNFKKLLALTFLYFLIYSISGKVGFFVCFYLFVFLKFPGKTDDKINTRSIAKCIHAQKKKKKDFIGIGRVFE